MKEYDEYLFFDYEGYLDQKQQQEEMDEVEENEAMRLGRDLEEYVARRFSIKNMSIA